MGNKNWWTSMAVIAILVLAACQPAARPSASPASPASPAASGPAASAGPPALPSTPTGYAELDAALTEKTADGTKPIYSGKRVTIQTQWILGEGANFDAAVADFEKATGIEIVQESIASQTRARAADPHRGQDPARPGGAGPADLPSSSTAAVA